MSGGDLPPIAPLGTTEAGRGVHVVCSPKAEYLAIITAYLPEADECDAELRIRRRP